MTKPNIYEYLSYRRYLKNRLESQGPKSGLKRKAAEALGVHTTFISQVVLGKADLSLDQAERMNGFLDHDDDEGGFFLDLLIYERATDQRLRKRYEAKIRDKHVQRSQIKTRLEKTKELDESEQERFYSSHLHGLLHVLSSIPEHRTRKAMASASGFPPAVVNDAIDFLIRIGILKSVKDQLLPGDQHIHLGRESRNIWRHHTKWRTATIQHLGFAKPSDLHYSLSFSCSEQDAQRIRESLLNHLKSMTDVVASSKEEKAYVYCFDFYQWV